MEAKGYASVAQFTKENGLQYQPTVELISGKKKPLKFNGELTRLAKEVLDRLDLDVEDAFTERQLKEEGCKIHIETSGAYELTGQWDWICLSPKKMKLPTKKVYEKADELKVIIYNKDDFKFAEEQAAKVNDNCILYMQPEWSKRDKMIPLIVDYVMANPKWKVSLQTHKYLNIP